MEMRIWWDYERDPSRPWSYEASFLNNHISGCCASLAQCWREIDTSIFVVTVPLVQDNHKN